MKTTYSVAVGRNWHDSDGTPAPDYTCGHNHKTLGAAEECGTKLYGAGYVRGNWQANAKWHGYYIIDNVSGHKVERSE